ncbi:acyl-CoA Delta-9 desaturase-like isoform X2 [Daktulosphaira vitifoliae]|uniref:acyl-CoA Delta-9 desaturase-like isoform X1 n=1 Tax=Daktulosphaira vitifoliae TaxID=58002 RepID=UPI0021A978A2|nr:acyl-CoA Delta-9 desaturase-like isoform X1 [Daktulosphaira vitifoliae]XP_050532113.1 acyl-CoA Delta-9 desaturase-like isoform X2 [Daktulosphaira vitifoliae]
MTTFSIFTWIWSSVHVYYDTNNRVESAQKVDQHHLTMTSLKPSKNNNKLIIVWQNVIASIILHIGAVYGFYLVFTGHLYGKTIIYAYLVLMFSGMGITVGAHRLWSHRCFNARLPLRILLATFQTLAFQNHIYEWVRDHRVHHKFTDTDADPYNSARGFFFSHIGWLLVRKHKDVYGKGKTIDMRDLEDDPVVMWQKKYYLLLVPIVAFILPSLVPYLLWNEQFWYSLLFVGLSRYMFALHSTWLVNSAAHIWGVRPYDKNISPTDNKTVAFLAFGEGWHNYHHTFPWDYKAAELGNYRLNFSTAFIDICAWLGLAYNLKTANASLVNKRLQRTGESSNKEKRVEVWGWGDTDMTESDKQIAQIS